MEPDLVGFRFHPTPQEIVNHHLKRKLQMIHDKDRCVIPDVDIYRYDPGELRAVYNKKSCRRSTSSHIYFFCPRKRINTNAGNSKHCNYNRKARGGFWKETSKKRVIEDEETGETIGTKRFYTFYYGNQRNSRRSDWVLHEYHLNEAAADCTIANPTSFVLCHIKKNGSKVAKANSNKQQRSKLRDSPCSESGGDLSASTDTPCVSEVIEAQETNAEGSPSITGGPQLLVPELEPEPEPEPSLIVSNAPNNTDHAVDDIFMLSDLVDDLGDAEIARDAAVCGEIPMESGAAAAGISVPLSYDMMLGGWEIEGNYAPNDADNDGFPLDVNSGLWGWN